MKKILLLMLIALMLVPGCDADIRKLRADDVKVETKIVPFNSSKEYRAYFALLDPDKPDSDYNELSQLTKQFIITWELNAEIRAKDPNRLYYGPYIIIIPPENKWEYAGTSHIIGEFFTRSFPYEIITNVLKDYPDYNWKELESFGWIFHAKSFDQGTINMAFKRRTDLTDANDIIRVYFLYYDPITKHGWAKEIVPK